MDEYINKADVWEIIKKGHNIYKSIKLIRELPTIEIVHCEECESRESGTYYCLLHSMMVNSDYFCADGGRRGDEKKTEAAAQTYQSVE